LRRSYEKPIKQEAEWSRIKDAFESFKTARFKEFGGQSVTITRQTIVKFIVRVGRVVKANTNRWRN